MTTEDQKNDRIKFITCAILTTIAFITAIICATVIRIHTIDNQKDKIEVENTK